MDDRELIAAILTAGMLPTLEIPQSRARGRGGPVTDAEGEAIQRAVDHAFGLSRLFLNGLRATPDWIMDSPPASHVARIGMRELYRSPNGDSWFLTHDPASGLAFVGHQANTPSGGQVTDIEIGAFLNGPRSPEHEALMSLIGTSILDPQATGADTNRLS